MAPRISNRSCPPGVLCFTPGLVLGLVAVAALLAFVYWKGGGGGAVAPATAPAYEQREASSAPISIQIAAGQGGDDRYTRAPKPERLWATPPDLPSSAEMVGRLSRIPTRGLPESYQSMGVLKLEDGALLPLYGRRTAARSDRFQYYTRTDTYNPVQLPLEHKRRDCQDDVGCEELMSGDSITVTPTGQRGVATIYRFDSPTYIPGLL